MTITEVGAQTGLSVHALRYYERLGLVAPVGRRRNGHRAKVAHYRELYASQLTALARGS